MIFKLSAITFAPTERETAYFYKTPSPLGAGDHLAVHISVQIAALRRKIDTFGAVIQPQSEGVSGLESIFFQNAQLQTGAQYFQTLQCGKVCWYMVQALTKSQEFSGRERNIHLLRKRIPQSGRLFSGFLF